MHRLLRTAILTAAASILAAGLVGIGGRAPAQADGVCPYADVTACAAPVNVTNSVSGHTVQLGWQFPSSGSTPYAQAIKRGPNGFQMSLIQSFDSGSVQTSYTDTNVPNGTWYYQVCSIYWDGSSDGEYDACVFANPQGLTIGSSSASPPPASSGSSAPAVQLNPPTGVSVSNITAHGALVTWVLPAGAVPDLLLTCDDPVVPNYGCALNEHANSAGFWALSGAGFQRNDRATWNMAAGYLPTSFQLATLQGAHPYNISVCTMTPQGAGLSCSAAVSFTTLPLRPAATAPSNLHFVKQTGDTAALVSFDPGSGGDEILVECTDLTANGQCTPYAIAEDATSAALSGLVDGHTYRVTVTQWQLSDDANTPAGADPVTIHIVKLSPPTPTGLQAVDRSGTALTLLWDSHADQATEPFATDIFRDGVKLSSASTADLTAASVRQAQALAGEGHHQSFFVDTTLSLVERPLGWKYVVCNVYQQYRGTADERLRTSCSAPLVVENFTIDRDAPVPQHLPIPAINPHPTPVPGSAAR